MLGLGFKFVAGLLAGLAAWAIIEPTNPGLQDIVRWSAFEMRLILALGAFVGLVVGALNGLSQGSRTHLVRSALLGMLLGAIGAACGYGIGGALAQMLFGGVRQGRGPLTMLSRVIALAPLGAALGAGIGFGSLSVKRATQGAVGGAIGAAIGAAVFDLVGGIVGNFQLGLDGAAGGSVGEVGSVPRAIFAAAMGGAIALFIGLVDLLTRSAWVRLRLGRNEGKEWSLDHAENFIGKSETAQIPLFGDPNVAPVHASIRRIGKNQWALVDGGSPAGTYVNGHRVQQCGLVSGTVIGVGGFQLEFLLKDGARAPSAAPIPVASPQAMAPAPVAPAYQPGSLYGSAPQPTQAYPASPAAPTQAYAPGALAAGPTLVVLDGPLAGQRFPLTGPFPLGREGSAIPLAHDTQLSRRHALLTPAPGGVMVQDLGSSNGTYVNGQKVTQHLSRPGDLVKVGGTTLRVE